MKKTCIIILMFTFSDLVFSQISTIVPFSSSVAHTSTADTHTWTAFNNPAMLGYIDRSEIGFRFENRFLLSELSTKTAQVGFVSKFVNVGLSFSHYGYSLYHEMLMGAGFARNFSDKFAMGVQFNYYSAYFSSTNSYRGMLVGQVGLSLRLSSNFNVGFNAFNPFQSDIKTEYVRKRIPSVFSLGTEYFFTPDLVWRLQIDKEVSSNYLFATGFEYDMLQKLKVKLGAYGYDYLIPCMGLGLDLGRFVFDLDCELHPLLGLNTLAGVKYHFKK